eukprot:sb/3467982/
MLLRRVLSIRRGNGNNSTNNRDSLRSHHFNDDFTGNCKSVSYYLSSIERHLEPKIELKGKPKKKNLRALVNLKHLLLTLIRDLENNSMGLWFNELVCDQQRGHEVLVKLLLSLLSTPERTVSKIRIREGCEQELCARCLVLVSTNRLGLNCLSTYEHGMFVLVQALGTGRQSTIKHVCVIMLLVCKHSQGAYTKLVSHLECYKRKSSGYAQYQSRFSVIINLIKDQCIEDTTYTAAVLRLLTAVIHSSPVLSMRIFYQLEVSMRKSVIESERRETVV